MCGAIRGYVVAPPSSSIGYVKEIKHYSPDCLVRYATTSFTGSRRWIKCENALFCKHPRTMCVGAEAEDCHLSGYTKVYVNARTGEVLLLGTHKYKKQL